MTQIQIFVEEVEKTLIQYTLKWNLLRCDKTDCGCGLGKKGLVGQIYKVYENIKNLKPMVNHHIIHQCFQETDQ